MRALERGLVSPGVIVKISLPIKIADMNVISELIAEHGRSRFARRLAVSPAATYRWEAGQLTAERALQIAGEFGIPQWRLRPDLWQPPSVTEGRHDQ